jgi:hypothetical protein
MGKMSLVASLFFLAIVRTWDDHSARRHPLDTSFSFLTERGPEGLDTNLHYIGAITI